MKIAVTGYRGQIGSRMVGLGYAPMDLELTKPLSIAREVQRVKPNIILHCAGISSIDVCEKNYEVAIDVNVRGVFNLCEEARKIGAQVVLLSSDYVFNGGRGKYVESDELDPVNNYGMTKMGAEAVINIQGGKIVRLSRTFNFASPDLRQYMKDVVAGKPVFIPDFLYRSYCNTDLVCESLDYYLQYFNDMPDILHIAGDGEWSYFQFISRFFQMFFGEEKLNLIHPRYINENSFSSRPLKCGISVDLAKSLGVPVWSLDESIERMKNG